MVMIRPATAIWQTRQESSMMVLAIDRIAIRCIRIYIGQAGRFEQIAGARIGAEWTA